MYYGETARNLHVRSKEHYDALRRLDKNSFMYKHILTNHKANQNEVKFDWQINGHFKKPLQRQLDEAVNIENIPKELSLNSKSEYYKHNVKRISINKEELKEQCNYCGRMFKEVLEVENHEKDFHMRYKCASCVYEAYGQKDLKQHVKIVHETSE